MNDIQQTFGKFGDAVIHRVIMEGMSADKTCIKLQMSALDNNIAGKWHQIILEFEEVYFLRMTSVHPMTYIIYSAFIHITDQDVIFDFNPELHNDTEVENPDSEFIIKAHSVSVIKIPERN